MLRKYVKDKHGNRVGVLVALDKDMIGWSKVHRPLDKWNKEKGLEIAMGRALTGSVVEPPTIISQELVDFRDRAVRYFKTSPDLYK